MRVDAPLKNTKDVTKAVTMLSLKSQESREKEVARKKQSKGVKRRSRKKKQKEGVEIKS